MARHDVCGRFFLLFCVYDLKHGLSHGLECLLAYIAHIVADGVPCGRKSAIRRIGSDDIDAWYASAVDLHVVICYGAAIGIDEIFVIAYALGCAPYLVYDGWSVREGELLAGKDGVAAPDHVEIDAIAGCVAIDVSLA